MSHFTLEDSVRLSLWHADLAMEIDLSSIFSSINATCGLLDIYNATSLPSSLVAHLAEICAFDLHNFRTFHDFLTGVSGRKPRFLLATLLTSVVSGIGGYIFGTSHSTSQTDVQLLANQDHFVQLFRENDHRAVLMQSEIHDLSVIVQQSSASARNCLILLSIFFFQAKQLSVTFRALETLILDGKLSPGLLGPDLLHQKYGHLAQQVSRQGQRLAIDTELDLFRCAVSFGTFTDETVRIVAHIPVTNDDLASFSLYRYHAVPLEEKGEFFQVRSPVDSYLLVNKERSRHVFVNALELSRCRPHSSFLSCDRFNGLRRRGAPSCLWALFTSNSTMMHAWCSLRSLPPVNRFWTFPNNQFLVFHGKSDTVEVSCGSKLVDSSYFAGLQLITLPDNCRAVSSSYELIGSSMVFSDDAVLRLAPVEVNTALLRGHSDSNSSAIARLLREASKDVHIPSDIVVPASPMTTYGGFVSLGCLGLVVVVILLLFVRWFRLPSAPSSTPVE